MELDNVYDNTVVNKPESEEKKEEPKKPEKIVKNGIEIHSNSLERTLWGIAYVVIGLIGSLAVFEGSYWLVSNFDLSYYWWSLIAVIFSFMFIQIYNKATGDMPSLLRTPIIFFTIIIFVLSLLIGWHHSEGKSAGHLDKMLLTANIYNHHGSINDEIDDINYQKQFIIIKNAGEVIVVSNLPKNTVVTVKIRGAAAIINGEKLLPSDYAIETDGDGKIICEGTRRITTSIEVIP